MNGRRDVWLESAEQARGALRFLAMVDHLSCTTLVRALSEVNRIGDNAHQLDALLMGLVHGPDAIDIPDAAGDEDDGSDLL